MVCGYCTVDLHTRFLVADTPSPPCPHRGRFFDGWRSNAIRRDRLLPVRGGVFRIRTPCGRAEARPYGKIQPEEASWRHTLRVCRQDASSGFPRPCTGQGPGDGVIHTPTSVCDRYSNPGQSETMSNTGECVCRFLFVSSRDTAIS